MKKVSSGRKAKFKVPMMFSMLTCNKRGAADAITS